ncbi:hypothetical protein L1987_06976 [Smallanthus sonchifolius]|uniref:Uncharacterized protein n=1 Tax=Smallanthus sonchifolius TaxID=185202 RepID=A0ACB9JZL9_9ASTR|nr:hypothetical protein L1987_06976 [Smallanthus sonchifolius]
MVVDGGGTVEKMMVVVDGKLHEDGNVGNSGLGGDDGDCVVAVRAVWLTMVVVVVVAGFKVKVVTNGGTHGGYGNGGFT